MLPFWVLKYFRIHHGQVIKRTYIGITILIFTCFLHGNFLFFHRNQREKALEMGEAAEADPVNNNPPAIISESLISGLESECDRDKELTSRCLKLLMQGRLTVHSALPKVKKIARNIYLIINLLVTCNTPVWVEVRSFDSVNGINVTGFSSNSEMDVSEWLVMITVWTVLY